MNNDPHKTRQLIETVKDAKTNEDAVDAALRPTNFDSYIGQREVIDNLRISVKAAALGNWKLDHMLFTGPAGVGKTSLAQVIAAEMGVHMRVTSAPAIQHKGELISMLMTLSQGDVLFIDEIHRLAKPLQELLYTAMEDFVVDMPVKSTGEVARMSLPRFTLLAATTHEGMVTGPMRDRFGRIWKLTTYTQDEMVVILGRSAKMINLQLDRDAAAEIARRSLGVPRIANRNLRRARDFAMIAASQGALALKSATPSSGKIQINGALAKLALDSLGIDSLGLEKSARRYLQCLAKAERPLGVDAISVTINEARVTVEETLEPTLLRLGLIERGKSGRTITAAGAQHLASCAMGDVS